jgi:hypothetical protein
MAGFEKVKLLTGEYRADYIRRRLVEGIAVKQIVEEINAEGFFSGTPGKPWGLSVVYAEQQKMKAPSAPVLRATPVKHDAEAPAVPPEYEGILEPEDVAEIQAEAQAALKKKQREQARKELLAKATQELEREARLAAKRGAAKGDLVDVYIDLAPAVCVGKSKHLVAPSICLDGENFFHGTTVRVRRQVAAVLWEQMQRSWQHDAGLKGNHDENAYRRHRIIDPRRDERVQGIA